jgi:hypothetical protein
MNLLITVLLQMCGLFKFDFFISGALMISQLPILVVVILLENQWILLITVQLKECGLFKFEFLQFGALMISQLLMLVVLILLN